MHVFRFYEQSQPFNTATIGLSECSTERRKNHMLTFEELKFSQNESTEDNETLLCNLEYK